MMILQEPIKTAIWHSLNHYAYADAIFLAERLFAEVGSNESLFLVATAYYRSGKPKVTQLLLEQHGIPSPQCKLLYARCSWELKDYARVEQIFTTQSWSRYNPSKGINLKGTSYIASVISEVQAEYGESACFALSLLGRSYLRVEQPEYAEQCLLASLKLNPFLWVPFEKMCQAGIKPNPDDIFTLVNFTNFAVLRSHHPILSSTTYQPQVSPAIPTGKFVSTDRKSHPDCANVLRARQPQNQAEQQQSSLVPMSLAPSSVFSIKSSKSQITVTNVMKSSSVSVYTEHMVTPPQPRVDFVGGLSTSGSLKPLPSSTSSVRDATIATGSEFLSSPNIRDYSEWDNSINSITNTVGYSAAQRSTKTQQRIGRGLIGGPASLSHLTPSFGILPLVGTPSPVMDRSMSLSMTTPPDTTQHPNVTAPVKKMATRQSRKPSVEQSCNANPGKFHFASENRVTSSKNSNTSNPSSTPSNQVSAPTRRSTRIFTNSGNSIKENSRNPGKGKFSQSKSTTKRQSSARSARELSDEVSKADTLSKEKSSNSANATSNRSKGAAECLMILLRNIAHGYLALCQFKCRDAISHFDSMPPHQRSTGWVLSALGRAHFELTEYNNAATIFKELRVVAPHYLQGLEIYSTTLWHLQKEVELSSLAQDMKGIDKFCFETWCAIGNCFSLQREHSSAASFFHRAVQLVPECSYAYTLLGHEMGLLEDLDGALACYRNAVRWNPRHYNAWYGIGTIYYKQEKFKMAEIHFKKALDINPQNSVLLCHIGIVQHALKQTALALQTIGTAVEMEPRNPLCKFHRANVLFAAEQYEDAARELKEVKEMVPKESLVHFLLGKVYKKLKQNHLAVINFSWAMDLDPKGANNQIKEAIDKQHLQDDDDMSDSAETNDDSILGTELLEQSSIEINDTTDPNDDIMFVGEGYRQRGSTSLDSDSESL